MRSKCQRCKKAKATERVLEILDRFEYRYTKACKKCAAKIRKETAQFSNY